MENVVITISRQYGSGGKTIAAMLAQKLGVNFYSRDILKMASEAVDYLKKEGYWN